MNTAIVMEIVLFCPALISCVHLYYEYLPAYEKITEAPIPGWSKHTNRDTKLYVLPNNKTTIHEPAHICSKEDLNKKNKVFLLIIVCSAPDNFDRRIAIRNTWANRKKYLELKKIFMKVREKYKNYNFTFDLIKETNETGVNMNASIVVPETNQVLQINVEAAETDRAPENRFEFDYYVADFDISMNNKENKYYFGFEYESYLLNKITPNGYEDTPDLGKDLSFLKSNKENPEIPEDLKSSNTEVDFKVAFLLGLPEKNYTETQMKIEEEIEKYDDVIQEDFIDSYNNLTLKSIMMLKWINNKCNQSVRYILKMDDDLYINMPNLVMILRDKAQYYDAQSIDYNNESIQEKEYLLIGYRITGSMPVLKPNEKWYTPEYMFGGRKYPNYLSGFGYLFSSAAASSLYEAALRLPYFHFEDIFITGMCARAAKPRLRPRDDVSFKYYYRANACRAHANSITGHKSSPLDLQQTFRALSIEQIVDRCERIRLTQLRGNKLLPKLNIKKKSENNRKNKSSSHRT